MILKQCDNTKFKEAKIRNTYTVRESAQTEESKYNRFYKSHDYNTNNCIQLKDEYERIIKKGKLFDYTLDDKMSQEDTPKRKYSPKKTIEVVVGKKENK